MDKTYQEIIESLDRLSLYELYRLKSILISKTEDSELAKQIKRQLEVGQTIHYFHQLENKVIEAKVNFLLKTDVSVVNLHDGKRWRPPYAAVCIDGAPPADIPRKNMGKLSKLDFQVGQTVSFYDNDDREQIGKVIKLNPKRAKVLLETGVTWNIYYQSLSRVLDGEVSDEKFIDVKLID